MAAVAAVVLGAAALCTAFQSRSVGRSRRGGPCWYGEVRYGCTVNAQGVLQFRSLCARIRVGCCDGMCKQLCCG